MTSETETVLIQCVRSGPSSRLPSVLGSMMSWFDGGQWLQAACDPGPTQRMSLTAQGLPGAVVWSWL
jgi:hypothetical protein